MTILIPPGVFDILPQDPKEAWRNSHLWHHVEGIIRETAKQYGYREIRTPLFERTELFQRGVGEGSDIVSKEMYTFEDKGGRSMTLRPEGTAPVIRSLIENQLYRETPIQKLFYIAPMFRYERSQAGRYRQHHQFGAEAIGNGSPEQDVELIDLVYTLYQRLGLKNLKVYLNSIGDASCRIAFKTALQNYLRDSFSQLSADSQVRFETNPLRILDSKDLNDRKILLNAPSILDFLNDECREHFHAVKTLLEGLNIPYEVNHQLVRGLDYYNKTVFEIVASELGAQNSIGGGGRYDGLVKTLGGPDLPSIGFGTGIERVIQTMLKQNVPMPAAERPLLFLIPLGLEAKTACFTLLHDLRQQGISVDMDFSGKKLNKVMQFADQIRAEYVVVLGEEELRSQEIELKRMETGEKMRIALSSLARILHLEIKVAQFTEVWEEFSRPFNDPREAEFFANKVNQTIKQVTKSSENLQNALEHMKNLL